MWRAMVVPVVYGCLALAVALSTVPCSASESALDGGQGKQAKTVQSEAAKGATEPVADTKDKDDKAKDEKANTKDVNGSIPAQELFKLRFGVGLGFQWLTSTRLAKGATVDSNGVVRVTDESTKFTPRALIESHVFICISDDGSWGWGPFVAVQPGGTNVIEGVGFGLMGGYRPYPKENDSFKRNQSWNLGIGAMLNPSVQVLGDGITKNEKLAPGDNLRFKNTSLWGALVFVSFSFSSFF